MPSRFDRGILCALAAATVSTSCAEDAAPERTPLARSVVLVTIDTLRADALGTYGNAEAHTPHLDRLAQRSLVFERAYSQATITHPSLSSVLTGLLPVRHGVSGQASRLAEGAVSTASLVRAAGIPTASFVANLCKLQDQPRTVFHDGWDTTFCGMDMERDQYLWDEAVVTAAIDWIEAQESPFFCWVHLMDPHAEHRPPPDLWDYDARPVQSKQEQYVHFGSFEEAREMPPPEVQRELWDLYAAEVTGADRQVGRLLESLEQRPDADELAVVFTSDHGEELYETWSRYDHGLSMTEGVLWVPLFVRAPGVAPARRADPVEILSIAPTVLELFGLEPRYPLDGASLLEGAERPFALSFTADISVSARTPDRRYWLRRTDEPYVRPPDQFPWRADAPWFLEKECLAEYDEETPTAVRWLDLGDAERAREAAELRARLETFAKGLERGKSIEIDDPELREQLEALGYAAGE